jgi:hypothetical protein
MAMALNRMERKSRDRRSPRALKAADIIAA